MAANAINITVSINTANAQANVNALNKGIGGIGSASQQAGQQASSAFNSFTVSIQQTNRALNQLMSAIGGLAAVRIAQSMIDTADAINRVEISFKALTGSAQVAADMMVTLRNIAKDSPFAFQDLADAAKRMQAFGFATKEIPDDVKAISNAVAAIGGGKEDIDRLTQALGIMREKGVAQAQQLFRQIAGRAIDVMKIIRDAHQQATGELLSDKDIRDLMEKGRLSGEAVAQAILDAMGKMRPATELMDLPSTQITKFKDELGKLAQEVEKDVLPFLGKLITTARDAVQWFEALPAPIRQTSEALVGIAGALTLVSAAAVGLTAVTGFLTTLVASGPALVGLAAILSGAVAAVGLKDVIEEFKGKPAPLANLPLLPPNAPRRDQFYQPAQTPRPTQDVVMPDLDLIEKQQEEAQAILARAREEDLKGLAAIYVKYQQYRQKDLDELKKAHAGSRIDQVTQARLAQAEQLEIDRSMQEQRDKIREQQLQADKEAIQNRIELAKSATDAQAEMAAAVVKDTADKEAAAQIDVLNIRMKGAEDVRLLMRQQADLEHQDRIATLNRDNAQQMAALKGNQKLLFDQGFIYLEQKKQIEAKYRDDQGKADVESAKAVAKARSDIVKQAADETTQHLKHIRDIEDNAAIASAERQVEIARLSVRDSQAQTAGEKISDIQESLKFEIDAAKNVEQVKQNIAYSNMVEEYNARLQLAQAFQDQASKLAAAGNALDAELNALVDWMCEQDKGLGQSAETAASKMRYQMDRLRTLAANFQLQRENTLTRHAESIVQSLFPGGVLQERVHGAAYYFARYGLELAETLCTQAADTCPGHKAIWL